MMDETDWRAQWEQERAERQRKREERHRERAKRDRAAFGEELWGISEEHRAATLDAARLQQFGLPVLQTEGALADWLGISLTRLRWFTHDRPAETTWHYVRDVIPKRSGGERVILAPKRELKALQRKVLDGLVSRVPTAGAAHGFVRGRSVVTNAQPHIGKHVVMKLDLKDFFPSITFPRVRGLFIALGYPFAVAATLALLCTEYDREAFNRDGTRYYISIGQRYLVQGAPTSPGLANLIAWRLDRRLSGLADQHRFTYTRYADDLTFSGDQSEAVSHLLATARHVIQDEHFVVNATKTRIANPNTRQIVTGLVVNETLSTPRPLRRRLRAMLHNASKEGLEAQNRAGHQDFRAYILGMIAYIQAANPQQAAALRASLARVDASPTQP